MNQFNLDEEYQKLKSVYKHNKAQSLMTQAAFCMGKKNMAKKLSCLKNVDRGQETNISKLRTNVDKLKNQLYLQNAKSPFKALNLQKGLALSSIKSNYCSTSTAKVTYPGIGVTNCGSDNNLREDYNAVNLGIQGEEVMIALNTKELNSFFNDTVPDAEIKKIKADFLKNCNKGKRLMPNLCDSISKQTALRNKFEQADIRLANIEIVRPPEDETNYFKDGLKVFGLAMISQAPLLINNWAQYDMAKTQTRNQIDYINNYDNSYMQQLGYWRENYRPIQPFYATNWGQSYTGLSYSDTSTFQNTAISQGNIYNNASPLNFNFNPIPVTSTI